VGNAVAKVISCNSSYQNNKNKTGLPTCEKVTSACRDNPNYIYNVSPDPNTVICSTKSNYKDAQLSIFSNQLKAENKVATNYFDPSKLTLGERPAALDKWTRSCEENKDGTSTGNVAQLEQSGASGTSGGWVCIALNK